MADVAREANVSLQTVSRAINGKPEISEETRLQVLGVAGRLGFHPSGIARSLATHRTTTAGLVVTDISNPFFSGIARGAEDVAYANSYGVFLCNTGEDVHREHAALDLLLEKQVDGVILASPRLEQSTLVRRVSEFAATVLINREVAVPAGARIGTVVIDDAVGTQAAVNHLVSRGHTRIGLLAGPQASWSGQNRLKGYEAGLRAHGLAPLPEYIVYCDPSIECGAAVARQLLREQPQMTAVLAYNDLVATGALQACRASGRRVPDDIAVIGCDDIPVASFLAPALTTLRIPTQDVGAAAMRLLIALLEGQDVPSQRIDFTPELVVRASAP